MQNILNNNRVTYSYVLHGFTTTCRFTGRKSERQVFHFGHDFRITFFISISYSPWAASLLQWTEFLSSVNCLIMMRHQLMPSALNTGVIEVYNCIYNCNMQFDTLCTNYFVYLLNVLIRYTTFTSLNLTHETK